MTWRQDRGEAGAQSKRESQRRVIARKRARIWDVKSRPCMDCGGVFPPYVMDLDHRPGEDKVFSVSAGVTRPWAEIEAEIAKCDVVCANCHRARTWTRIEAARLDTPARDGLLASERTHCPKGHPYAGENLRVVHRSDRAPQRQCVTCHREGCRRGYQKRTRAALTP